MTKDDEMKVLADLADSMHKVAEGLETMAIYLLRDVTEAAQSVPQPKPVVSQITLEELRAGREECSRTYSRGAQAPAGLWC